MMQLCRTKSAGTGGRPLLAVAVAAALAGCGSQEPLQLPADPIDRAATCGVVAAASARTATPIEAPLPLEAQGRILHHTLLAGARESDFDGAAASRVSERMAQLQESITGGDWKALAPACATAFPLASTKAAVTLPESRLDAQLVCVELADFLSIALEGEEINYGNELAAYRRLRRTVNDALAPGLAARAGRDREAQQKARGRALSAAARLGTPTAVLARCQERFE